MENSNTNENNNQTSEEEAQELTFDEMYPDEEIDEETRNIIFNRINDDNNDFNFINIKTNKKEKKDKKDKKDKSKNENISIKKFLESIEEKSNKWVSKRLEDKKKDNKENESKTTKLNKRKLNPRLPPYNQVFDRIYKKETDFKLEDDENQFPTLKNI